MAKGTPFVIECNDIEHSSAAEPQRMRSKGVGLLPSKSHSREEMPHLVVYYSGFKRLLLLLTITVVV